MNPIELEGIAGTIASTLLVLTLVYAVVEVALLHFRRRALRLRESRMAFLGFASNGFTMVILGALWGPFGAGVAAVLGASVSPIASFGLGAPAWIYGWLLYEFWYWVQHWSAHKVRLLWCIHSPHHAPGAINMLVGTNHHLVEGVFYLPFFAGFMPALFGVDPIICVAINVVDSVWGSFLHISNEILPVGRYGVIGRLLQTPAHHRAHHSQNALYLDTNYNSITLFWDWALGTLQPLRDEEAPVYGITREVDTGSFWDAHFGEFTLLARDVRSAESWGDSLRYLLKAPGWKPGDASQTAANRKRALSTLTDAASS